MVMKSSAMPPAAFEISSFALAPKFPALRFTSFAAFQSYRSENQSLLDSRYEYEISKATREAVIVQPGTCAPCLRACVFTSNAAEGERLKNGSQVPNWRESMHCDCEDNLNNRRRALLHFVQASGVLPWARLLLLGAEDVLDARLSAMVQEVITQRDDGAVPGADGVHIAVSLDYFQGVHHPSATLAALCGALLDGGRFLFSVPFHHSAVNSILADPQEMAGQGVTHRFGWDLLDMLRAAGFRDAAAYLYWSEEFGYLGPMNFVFRAVK